MTSQTKFAVGDFVKFKRDGNKGRVIKDQGDGYFVVYLPSRATIVVHERELSFLPKNASAAA